MLRFNEFVYEKMHVNDEVLEVAEQIYKKIKDYKIEKRKHRVKLNLEDYPFLNSYLKSFEIIIVPDSKIAGLLDFNPREYSATIILDPKIELSTIAHELNHAYQYLAKTKSFAVGLTENKPKRKKYDTYKMSYILKKTINSEYANENVRDFLELIYYSSNEELSSYIVDFYYEIRKSVDIKDTDAYKIAIPLMNSRVIADLLKKSDKYLINFVSLVKTEIDYDLTIPGRDDPNIVKNLKKHPDYDELTHVTLQEARDFIQFWKRTFESQGKKLYRKISKMWYEYQQE